MNNRTRKPRRERWLLAGLMLFLVGFGPCGPISGGQISGTPASTPASDWSFTNDISNIQVETKPGDPYSVTTWCVTDGKTLWVPSREAERKPWAQNALADPHVRLGIDGTIYSMRAVRVSDPEEMKKVISLLRDKYRLARWGMDPDPAKAPDTWYFRME